MPTQRTLPLDDGFSLNRTGPSILRQIKRMALAAMGRRKPSERATNAIVADEWICPSCDQGYNRRCTNKRCSNYE